MNTGEEASSNLLMANILTLVSFKIYPPDMGGQKGVALFYKYLSKHHKVFMQVSNDNTETIEAAFPIQKKLYPNKKIIWNLFVLTKLRSLMKANKIDCIIAEHSYTGWIAWLLKVFTGKPFIIHSHNLEAYRFKQMKRNFWGWYWHYEKWIHQKADHSFFISEEDKEVAVTEFKLEALKCTVIPYGFEKIETIENAKELLKQKLKLSCTSIFYFNGTLDYQPNIEAVVNLIDHINPLLQKQNSTYKILITGKRLPLQIQNKIKETTTIIYLDFVVDINLLYQGADVFLNTVVNNSGVKTKLIEALAHNCSVVSTVSGATGIPKELYGNKLITSPDNNWLEFVNKIYEVINQPKAQTSSQFFNNFSWNAIAAKAADKINSVVRTNA